MPHRKCQRDGYSLWRFSISMGFLESCANINGAYTRKESSNVENSQGAMALRHYEDNPNNGDEISVAAKLGLLGAVITTFGDALATLAAAVAIEESKVADLQQQQQIEKLQQQIDHLIKEQAEMSERNARLEEMIGRKGGFDNRQKK